MAIIKRLTEGGDTRVTEAGDDRVTEASVTPTFFDDFNRADQDLEDSPNWTNLTSGQTGAAAIVSNQLHNTTTDFVGGVYVAPDTGTADHFAEGAWQINNANCFCGVLCRVADENNYVLGHWGEGSPRAFNIWHIIGGSFTKIGTAAGTPDIGDVIRLEVEGNNARLKVNGSVVISDVSIDNAATNGQTRAGLASRDGNPLGVWLDDFASGELSVTGTLGATDTQDAAAFSGEIVFAEIEGDLAVTEAQDGASFLGGIDIGGVLIDAVRFDGLDFVSWTTSHGIANGRTGTRMVRLNGKGNAYRQTLWEFGAGATSVERCEFDADGKFRFTLRNAGGSVVLEFVSTAVLAGGTEDERYEIFFDVDTIGGTETWAVVRNGSVLAGTWTTGTAADIPWASHDLHIGKRADDTFFLNAELFGYVWLNAGVFRADLNPDTLFDPVEETLVYPNANGSAFTGSPPALFAFTSLAGFTTPGAGPAPDELTALTPADDRGLYSGTQDITIGELSATDAQDSAAFDAAVPLPPWQIVASRWLDFSPSSAAEVVVPHDASLNLTSAGAVLIRLRVGSFPSGDWLTALAKRDRTYQLRRNGSGSNLVFTLRNDAGTLLTGGSGVLGSGLVSGTVTGGGWHNLICEWSVAGNVASVWHNDPNTPTDTSGISGNVGTNTANLRFGRHQAEDGTLQRPWPGDIAGVALLDRTLTAQERADFMADLLVPGVAVSVWPFDEGSGATVFDPAGGNDGTISLAEWQQDTLPAVTGDLAATDVSDSAAFTGDVATVGDLAAVDSQDAASFEGDVQAAEFFGNLGTFDHPDAASVAGAVIVAGDLEATDDPDIAAIAGATESDVEGDLAATDQLDAASFSGALPAVGDLAATEAQDAAAFQFEGAFVRLLLSPDAEGQYLIEARGATATSALIAGGTSQDRLPADRHVAERSQDIDFEVFVSEFRWADIEWTGKPGDPDRPNRSYDGRASVPFRLSRNIPIEPEDSPRLNRQLGEIELINADGTLDSIVRDTAIAGRPVRILFGPRHGPYADFALIADVLADRWDSDGTVARLYLRDRTFALDERLQSELYAGTGGREGTEETAGKPKPRAWGVLRNIRPNLIDPANNVFQVNSGLIESVDAVYDRGLALDPASPPDYVDYDALIGASLSGGEFATSLAEGMIRTGVTPDGLLTADVKGTVSVNFGYADTLRGIVLSILRDDAAVPEERVVEGSFPEDGPIGWYVTSEEVPTFAEVLDEIVSRTATFWGVSRIGQIRGGRIIAPEFAPIAFRFDQWNAIDFRMIETRLPRWRQRVEYRRNWTVQRGEDLAAGVSSARRQFLAQEFRSVAAADTQVRFRSPQALDGLLRSVFDASAQAEEMAQRLVDVYGPDRKLYELLLPRSVHLFDLGSVVRVDWPRLAPNGKNLIIVGIDEDTAVGPNDAQVGTLLLWG